MELNDKIQLGNINDKLHSMLQMGLTKEEIENAFSKSEKDLLMKHFGSQIHEQAQSIEKSMKANIGEIHTWNGKKMRKEANGKWVGVSDYGLSRKEHKEGERQQMEIFKPSYKKKEVEEHHKKREAGDKLSDKEYTDEEVGIKDYEDKIDYKGVTIHVGKDRSGGQDTTTYKAPDISKETFWKLDKLKEKIDEQKGEKKEEPKDTLKEARQKLQEAPAGAKASGGGYSTFTKERKNYWIDSQGTKMGDEALGNFIGGFRDFKVK